MAHRSESPQFAPENRFIIHARDVEPIRESHLLILRAHNDPHTVKHQERVGEFSALLAHHSGKDNIFRAHAWGLGGGHDCGKDDKEIEPLLYAEKDLKIAYSNGANLPRDIWNVIGMHPRVSSMRARQMGLPDLYVEGFKHHHTPRVRTPGHRGVTLAEVEEVYGYDLRSLMEILQIADSFDSMVNPHYLKEPKSPEIARDEIIYFMETGRYAPELKRPFLGMFKEVVGDRRDLLTLAA